jgi:hypothetical protein
MDKNSVTALADSRQVKLLSSLPLIGSLLCVFQAEIFEALVACAWKTKMADTCAYDVSHWYKFPAAILQLFVVKMIDLSFS